MVDPERPQARRVQAGADRELGRSAFNHPAGVGGILGARGVFVLGNGRFTKLLQGVLLVC